MDSKSLHRFEKLKKLVAVTAGFKHLLPSECKSLSAVIFQQTNKGISETTLKRLYGFARSNFKPSSFTLNAMSEFCGFDHWEDYCKQEKPKSEPTAAMTDHWQSIRRHAHKITGYTLQAIKNRSGVPYSGTIRRDFFSQHMDAFNKSGKQATVLLAPAGYGKTIALSHWIEEQIYLADKANNSDIFLLFSSCALVNGSVSKRNLDDWLLSILGADSKSNVIDLIEKDKNKFFLIIDGFDDAMFKPHWFHLLLRELTDIISMHKIRDCFKVVLTMRSATWINHQHALLNGQDNWHLGNAVQKNTAINVPLFGQQELQALAEINFAEKNCFVQPKWLDFLACPLYYQFYYQAQLGKFSKEPSDIQDIQELLLSYILNNVYKGPLYTDKLLLVKGLMEEMDYVHHVCTINKLRVHRLLKQYPLAYSHLLSIGYLKELNTSKDLIINNYIEFGNSDLLEHAIAHFALLKHKNHFDEKIVRMLIDLPINKRHKMAVLKWCYLHSIKNRQLVKMHYITTFGFSPTEEGALIEYVRKAYKKALENVVSVTDNKLPGNRSIESADYRESFVNTEFRYPLR